MPEKGKYGRKRCLCHAAQLMKGSPEIETKSHRAKIKYVGAKVYPV